MRLALGKEPRPRGEDKRDSMSVGTLSDAWVILAGNFQISWMFLRRLVSSVAMTSVGALSVDPVYPGTAVARMHAARDRARSLSVADLSTEWETVRQKLLWAAGLRDLNSAAPGMGYTGHAFNDYNHCDATTMLGEVAHSQNDGSVKGIAIGNKLGKGIEIASLPELGEGGSWSTCTNGCHLDPPQDVAHIQFRSRIAFKLVWCPSDFATLVLVDDEGELLATGTPAGRLPQLRERQQNYAIVKGSKYAREAERVAARREGA
jgi:hypothetical protein